jgi:hypothetical protein
MVFSARRIGLEFGKPASGGIAIERQFELPFPIHFRPRLGHAVIPVSFPGQTAGGIRRMRRNPMGDNPLVDILFGGQTQVLRGCHITQQARPVKRRPGSPDARSNVIVASRDVGHQRS